MHVFDRGPRSIAALILAFIFTIFMPHAAAWQSGAGAAGRQAQELFDAKRYAEAKDRATQGAGAGDAASMYVLSEIYASGNGAAKDQVEAAQWLSKAADGGFAPAMNALGSAYELGRGVDQNFARAAAWYRRAAEKGDGAAMNHLGHLYEIAAGVPKDYAQAFQWRSKAADAGTAAAMTSLGLMYENGRVANESGQATGPDFGAALQWYERAAKAGDPEGTYRLALCYEIGKGTAPDPERAREWRRKATDAGWNESSAPQGNGAPVRTSAAPSTPAATGQLTPAGPCKGATRPEKIAGSGITVTPAATKLRARGEIDVKITIQADGTVSDPVILAPFGYGMEEKALEAARQWRFRPSVRDGVALACPSQIGFVTGEAREDQWSSSRMLFAPEAGVTPPVVKDGSMPKGGESPSDESIFFDFIVDARGSLREVVNRYGAPAAVELIEPYLKTWKFQPAVKDGHAVEATGRVWFFKGKGSYQTVNRQIAPPPPATTTAQTNAPPATVRPQTNAPPPQTAACLTAPSGMVGWWSGDNDEKDMLGRHHPSKVNALRLVPGKIGKGFAFGNEGYIEIPQSPDLQNQRFTWLAWVRPDGAGVNPDSLIVNQNIDASLASVLLGWRAQDQRFTFRSGTSQTDTISSAGRFPPGAFYLVAGTYDGESFKLYVNGIVEGTLSQVKRVAYSTLGWEIGSGAQWAFPKFPHTWVGVIDEVQAYNRALSQEEILSIFRADSAGMCRGTAAAANATVPPSPASSTPPPGQPVGARRIRTMLNPRDNQVYIWIQPGSFTKGCSPGDGECGPKEKPPRDEKVESGFWLGQTEVTQAAFQALMDNNPSAHKGDRLPVENVTWNEAVSYCSNAGGRLPTDTQWEYAARAGATGSRYGDLDAIAWHSGNSGGATHPVAEKQPNAFGLYDMLGNVWEWVQDAYPGTQQRILRGGSLFVASATTRASAQMPGDVQARFMGRGFRCTGQWPAPEAAASGETPVPTAPSAQAPTAPAPVAGTGGPDRIYRNSGDVTKPILIRKIEPEYSEEARKAKIEGVVVLMIVIDAKGNVENPRVMRSLGKGLDEKAIESVRKWKFEPARKDGKPVAMQVTIEVNFRLL